MCSILLCTCIDRSGAYSSDYGLIMEFTCKGKMGYSKGAAENNLRVYSRHNVHNVFAFSTFHTKVSKAFRWVSATLS